MLLSWCWFGMVQAQEPVSYKAYTYVEESGDLWYTEVYHESFDSNGNLHASSQFRTPDGDLLATRTIAYEHSYMRPSYTLDYASSDYKEEVWVSENSLRLKLHDPYTGSITDETLSIGSRHVIDAGFHYAILQHWDALLQGQTIRFPFLIPAQGSFFTFRVQMVLTSLGAEDRVAFAMESDSFLIRLFSPKIVVEYDRKEKKLLSYHGPSNLMTPDGRYETVHIQIDHQPAVAQLNKESEFQ